MIWHLLKDSAGKIFAKVKGYARENWGVPFILAFMLLLVITAASLAADMSFLANELVVYAYYALVAGVVLQHVCF